MNTVLLDLHAALGDGWGWCQPLLYPLQEQERLHLVPAAGPRPFGIAALEQAAVALRAWASRANGSRWQLVVLLAADGAHHGPEHGPLAGQVQHLLEKLVAPLQTYNEGPVGCWCLVLDRLEREDITAAPHSARAHALFQHDTAGFVEEGSVVPDGFCAAHLPELFTRFEVEGLTSESAVATLFAKKRNALETIKDRAPAYTLKQLASLEAALKQQGGDQEKRAALFRTILGVTALPNSVRLLRLPGFAGYEQLALPCLVLEAVHLIQVLVTEPQAAAWFPQPQGGTYPGYVCTQYERDDPALAEALQRYHHHLAITLKNLEVATEEQIDFTVIEAPTDTADFPFTATATDVFPTPKFQDRDFNRNWEAWLNKAQKELDTLLEQGKQAPGKQMRVHKMETEAITIGKKSNGDMVLLERKTLRDFISYCERNLAAALKKLTAQPRPAFPEIDLVHALSGLTRRLRATHERMPSRKRFWITVSLVALVLVALPFVVVQPPRTFQDFVLLLPVLGVLFPVATFVTWKTLIRPLEKLIRDGVGAAEGHRLHIKQITQKHLVFVENLLHVRAAHQNLKNAQGHQQRLDRRNRMEAYHGQTIRRHQENGMALRKTCFPGLDAQAEALQPPILDREGVGKPFYALTSHVPAPETGYSFSVDGTGKDASSKILGLRRFDFKTEAFVRRSR